MKVNLKDVIECLEHEGEHLTHFYNKDTGVIMYVEDENTSSYTANDYERLKDFEEWEQELIKMLYDYNTNKDNYIQLPSIKILDEFNLMVEFLSSLNDSNIKESLLLIAREKNNLRKLREKIEEAGISNDWYDYREAAENEIAIKWCNDNNISIE